MTTTKNCSGDYRRKPKPIQELLDFDWFAKHDTAPKEAFKPSYTSIMQLTKKETPYERKLQMLRSLATTCTTCSMCELGRKEAVKNNEARDPHVLSNLNPQRFIVIGQGPGWTELQHGQPFVGPSGNNFDCEITKHGLSRNDFYITNAVRCFIANNAAPTVEQIQRCRPFLDIEINLLRPLLLITLGAVAFSVICPNLVYADSLGKICTSFYGIRTLPIYHPSPLNLADPGRRGAFARQIKILAAVVKHLSNKDSLQT